MNIQHLIDVKLLQSNITIHLKKFDDVSILPCSENLFAIVDTVSKRKFGKYAIDVLEEQDLLNVAGIIAAMYIFAYTFAFCSRY